MTGTKSQLRVLRHPCRKITQAGIKLLSKEHTEPTFCPSVRPSVCLSVCHTWKDAVRRFDKHECSKAHNDGVCHEVERSCKRHQCSCTVEWTINVQSKSKVVSCFWYRFFLLWNSYTDRDYQFVDISTVQGTYRNCCVFVVKMTELKSWLQRKSCLSPLSKFRIIDCGLNSRINALPVTKALTRWDGCNRD